MNGTFANSVIPRYELTTQSAVLFFADEEPKNTVKAFTFDDATMTKGTIKEFPLETYKATLPLNDQESDMVVEAYKKVTNLSSVQRRSRMPYQKMKRLISRLSQDASVPAEQAQVLKQMVESDKKISERSKRSQAALMRHAQDNLTATLSTIVKGGGNMEEDAMNAASKELGERIAKIILTTLMK